METLGFQVKPTLRIIHAAPLAADGQSRKKEKKSRLPKSSSGCRVFKKFRAGTRCVAQSVVSALGGRAEGIQVLNSLVR